MTESVQLQSTAPEEQVRAAILQALAPHQPKVTANQPGSLAADIGSVGMAYLVGGLRNEMKMPVTIVVSLNGGPTGTGLTVAVQPGERPGEPRAASSACASRSGRTQKWLELLTAAVPGRTG